MSLLIFIIGICLGSFFNVVSIRLPKGEGLSYPPSHCVSCNHKLNAADLVPLLSYLFLRGRCRYCKNKISPVYFIGEILTGLVFLLPFIMFGLSINFLICATSGSALIIVLLLYIERGQ